MRPITAKENIAAAIRRCSGTCGTALRRGDSPEPLSPGGNEVAMLTSSVIHALRSLAQQRGALAMRMIGWRRRRVHTALLLIPILSFTNSTSTRLFGAEQMRNQGATEECVRKDKGLWVRRQSDREDKCVTRPTLWRRPGVKHSRLSHSAARRGKIPTDAKLKVSISNAPCSTYKLGCLFLWILSLDLEWSFSFLEDIIYLSC